MKKTIKLFLAVSVTLSFAACSSKTNEGTYNPSNEINQALVEESISTTNTLGENSLVVEAEAETPAITQSEFKIYSNQELGFSFKYPKTWPEPSLITDGNMSGGIFEEEGQWQIGLGELHKASLEGADKYFATISGFYLQSKADMIKKIKSDEINKFVKLIKETDSYIVYSEVGMVGVKNIMIFNGDKAVRINSLEGTMDSEIDSIAESLIFN